MAIYNTYNIVQHAIIIAQIKLDYVHYIRSRVSIYLMQLSTLLGIFRARREITLLSYIM